jgi:hypothetical protein
MALAGKSLRFGQGPFASLVKTRAHNLQSVGAVFEETKESRGQIAEVKIAPMGNSPLCFRQPFE